MSVKAKQAAKQKVAALPYQELIDRQQTIQTRLDQIGVQGSSSTSAGIIGGDADNKDNNNNSGNTGSATAKRGRRRKRTSPAPTDVATTSISTAEAASNANATANDTPLEPNNDTATFKIPYIIKPDIHWDFLMAEMKWLSADFQRERKQQVSLAKKQSSSIKKYIKTKEKRNLQKLVQMELKRRKLASKIARDVNKGWWENKINRIISYKQKVDGELVKKRSMDRHLIQLVKQTERYSNLLTNSYCHENSNNDNDNGNQSLTIEEALAQADHYSTKPYNMTHSKRTRRTKRKRIDVHPNNNGDMIDTQNDDDLFQQEKIKDESGVVGGEDVEFTPSYELDDETTIEAEEKLGRDMSYEDEINTLQKENEMSVDELKALYYNINNNNNTENENEDVLLEGDHTSKSIEYNNVKTETTTMKTTATSTSNKKETEDMKRNESSKAHNYFDEGEENEQQEFQPPTMGEDIDDETTIEAEEILGRDMSYKDEISMLNKENEMSVEELKALYYGNDDNDDVLLKSEDETNSDTMDIVENTDIQETSQQSSSTSDSPKVDPFSVNDNSAEDEFKPQLGSREDVDDETTIEAEEMLGRDMSYEDEISLLNKENEMSVEELRKLYLGASTNDVKYEYDDNLSDATSVISNRGDMSNNDDTDINKKIKVEEEVGRDLLSEEEVDVSKEEKRIYVKEERNGNGNGNEKTKIHLPEKDIPDEAETAMRSLEIADAKARNTAVSRPFLLASWVKLRAYQQIGLNWLVSTQTRRLNAILADEMGLGKTLQTIALLSYLACYKGIWGPHLIIVPTSCIVNWEMELKRFAPGLKVLCYYGSAKRRKELRQGWTKTNWHHVIITSYQIVVQDSFAFKRKKWYYLILDEAHNIKNFQSQRWQTLINFNTQRRLLLTGTPLQNNLMELWSLLHFLMPYIFRSRKEFSQWFSNPMNNIIEGNTNRNDDLIGRLHGIIRPFVLRRLKKDVETQMPGKYEHIVKCHLSRRQMFLYEEFMARSSTRMALQKGSNYMGMMNVLMQLRKVCNHPDLFEPRSIITPLYTDSLSLVTAGCIVSVTERRNPFEKVSPNLLHPVWTIGTGTPCAYTSMKHDTTTSLCLKSLKPPEREFLCGYSDEFLMKGREMNDDLTPGQRIFLQNIWKDEQLEKERLTKAHMKINAGRCENAHFLIPTTTLDAMTIDPKIPTEYSSCEMKQFRVAATPKALLGMKKSQDVREKEMSSVLEKFLCYVPKAGAKPPLLYSSTIESNEPMLDFHISDQIANRVKCANTPFFPDKKLVQFDSCKLQVLSELLASLKQGKHRVLIFTQMSKMLDILEVFLNLNGHTYLRLDGSTGVEKRQKLMDRFNNDEKVFCFILSTRSGGLGINLTGADTVVFYDSDWNPAMDAQAQDRAHRIGQTRDVHIYRLVTQHTIEENILVKAQQKRHLDFLVMDEGNFNASISTSVTKEEESESNDVNSKSGLRSILGLQNNERRDVLHDNLSKETELELSKEEMESAMAKLEDEDDVLALRGAQKEAEEELQEFDETVKIKTDPESDAKLTSGESEESDQKNDLGKDEAIEANNVETEEAKLEKEFTDWQRQVGADKESIHASLNAVEKYALGFREDIDPYYSMWYLSEQQRQEAELIEDEVDIGRIEQIKAEAEFCAIEDGDLLATLPSNSNLPEQRHLYFQEKSRIKANRKRRKLTGENWKTEIDGKTKLPFWYNSDTGEAVWDKPKILHELHEEETARELQWNALPLKPLIAIMCYLVPYPNRMVCASVCKQWRKAAQDISFVRHVYPVEMGALSMNPDKMEKYHYRTVAEALETAQPGDTIELGDGHYWINDPAVIVKCPLRIIGDEKDPSHVVLEVSGSLVWNGKIGYIEGVTFRRPRISSNNQNVHDFFTINANGKLIMKNCVFEGNGGATDVVSKETVLKGNGIVVNGACELAIFETQITNHHGVEFVCDGKSNK